MNFTVLRNGDRSASMLMLVMCCALLMAPAQAGSEPAPLALIRQTTASMINALLRDKDVIQNNPQRVYELAEQIVLPHFDIQRMAKLVLGRYWRKASAEQRRRFTKEFRSLLVRTYAASMQEYSDEQIIYLPYRALPDATDVIVSVEVTPQTGFPIPIDYKLSLKNGEWRVYEVVIDSVSLIVNYRTSFAQEIRKQGGLDGLISKLRKRNEQAQNES